MLCCWRRIKRNRAMAGHSAQEVEHGLVIGMRQKRVIPGRDDLLLNDGFDARKIDDHALFGIAVGRDDVAAYGHLDGVTMTVQVPALTVVMRNSVAGVEF